MCLAKYFVTFEMFMITQSQSTFLKQSAEISRTKSLFGKISTSGKKPAVRQSHKIQIMHLVIYGLGDGHTDMYIQIPMSCTKVTLKNQACSEAGTRLNEHYIHTKPITYTIAIYSVQIFFNINI